MRLDIPGIGAHLAASRIVALDRIFGEEGEIIEGLAEAAEQRAASAQRVGRKTVARIGNDAIGLVKLQRSHADTPEPFVIVEATVILMGGFEQLDIAAVELRCGGIIAAHEILGDIAFQMEDVGPDGSRVKLQQGCTGERIAGPHYVSRSAEALGGAVGDHEAVAEAGDRLPDFQPMKASSMPGASGR